MGSVMCVPMKCDGRGLCGQWDVCAYGRWLCDVCAYEVWWEVVV